MEMNNEHAKEQLPFTLRRFHISEEYGFLLPNPLKELPPFYSPWMEIAHKLPSLIESHQLRSHVNKAGQPLHQWDDGQSSSANQCGTKMPLLSSQYLQGHRELSLARLVLTCITMGYVWQEGEKRIAKVLPQNVAIPLGEISQALGLPPILVHTDLVLVNWKKKNPYGLLEIENLEPVISFPGGASTSGFILVSFLVERVAAPGIKAMAKAVNGILQLDNRILEEALQEMANTLRDMTRVLKKMHDYVDPSVFYSVTRIFFSGWKDNPALPEGLVYEGLCEAPLSYSGGSAAQSTTLHAFDELLGIRHHKESTAFLHSMREYMPPPHRAFIEEIQAMPPLRRHVSSSGNEGLRSAYNTCVAALSDLRTYHITMVTKYIIITAHNTTARPSKPTSLPISPHSCLEGRGTGGSGVMSFLKSVRDTTREAMLTL